MVLGSTDELVSKLAKRAEAGYDVEQTLRQAAVALSGLPYWLAD
jgi:hypothetical protein